MFKLIIVECDQIRNIEFIVLAIILVFQIYFTVLAFNKILIFRGIFSKKCDVAEDDKEASPPHIIYSGINSTMKIIILTINNYLDKNLGAVVDYHILKDIVNRNVDNLEEDISNKIPAPLYLGLSGTMIGIIIGLYFLDLASINDNTSLDISPFIDGIRYAMFVSVTGLIITTVLSVVIFRLAKSRVNTGRNQFLSFLQTDLLPNLNQSDDASIKELSLQLNHFSKQTPTYVSTLLDNTNQIKQSIETEIKILEEVKSLDINRLSSANVTIFKELSGLMDQFVAFPQYYKELNSSLSNTIRLNNNLSDLVSKTENVNLILREVKDIIESGSEATTFFNAHIRSFEKYSDSVNNSVAKADQKMEEAMLQLNLAVQKQFEVFSLAVSKYDTRLSNAFDVSIEKLNDAYKNSTPQFEKLDHLVEIEKKLEGIKDLHTEIKAVKSLTSYQNNLLEKQNLALSSLNISLPKDVKIEVQQEKKTPYYYLKESLFLIASAIVLGFIIYIIYVVSR